jgi:hypothetical protein
VRLFRSARKGLSWELRPRKGEDKGDTKERCGKQKDTSVLYTYRFHSLKIFNLRTNKELRRFNIQKRVVELRLL